MAVYEDEVRKALDDRARLNSELEVRRLVNAVNLNEGLVDSVVTNGVSSSVDEVQKNLDLLNAIKTGRIDELVKSSREDIVVSVVDAVKKTLDEHYRHIGYDRLELKDSSVFDSVSNGCGLTTGELTRMVLDAKVQPVVVLNRCAFRVYLGSNQTLVSGVTLNPIPFDRVVFDESYCFDLVNYVFRAKMKGKYLFILKHQWGTNVNSGVEAGEIWVNDSVWQGGAYFIKGAGTGYGSNISVICELEKGDTVNCRALQGTGANLDLLNGNAYTFFSGFRL